MSTKMHIARESENGMLIMVPIQIPYTNCDEINIRRVTVAIAAHTRIVFETALRIHSRSPFVYASVNADQSGAVAIAKNITIILKYLNAILYSVTSAGPNNCVMIKLSVVNIII
jgi:hypothetical protein